MIYFNVSHLWPMIFASVFMCTVQSDVWCSYSLLVDSLFVGLLCQVNNKLVIIHSLDTFLLHNLYFRQVHHLIVYLYICIIYNVYIFYLYIISVYISCFSSQFSVPRPYQVKSPTFSLYSIFMYSQGISRAGHWARL